MVQKFVFTEPYLIASRLLVDDFLIAFFNYYIKYLSPYVFYKLFTNIRFVSINHRKHL